MNTCHINKKPNKHLCSLDNKNKYCFDEHVLKKLVEIYNKKVSDNHIDIKNDTNYLIKELYNRLKDCDDQICFLSYFKSEIKKDKELMDQIKSMILPEGPLDNTWLNTDNINDIMKQFEKIYPKFKFLAANPIDIDTYVKPKMTQCKKEFFVNTSTSSYYNKMSCENFIDLQSKYNYLGFIFNMDKHNEPGSHWTALFVDLLKHKMYYFDSVGVKPPKEIYNLQEHLNHDSNNKFELKYNNVEHQKGDSECGVYSINFLSRMLNGERFDEIIKNPINDNDMHNCRSYYFVNY